MFSDICIDYPLLGYQLDEDLLIASARAGNLDAFNNLLVMHQDAVYRTALRVLADEGLAQDAVQNAFISAFQHFETFHGGSLKAWLLRIVINKCHDQTRTNWHRLVIPFNDLPDQEQYFSKPDDIFDNNVFTVEQFLDSTELAEFINACLLKMPLEYRTVVVMADIENLSYSEMAVVLSIPVGTVKSRLSRARNQLRVLIRLNENI